MYLWGTNTYTGPTTVRMAKLFVKKTASLYNANTAQWTPAKISVHPGATLVLSAGGPGEFSGEQIGTLLRNLTTSIDMNGLMAASTLCLDTTNAKDPVTVSTDVSDSKGPGGGAFLVRKMRGGYAAACRQRTPIPARRFLRVAQLSVSSLNSFTQRKGKASSSLGARRRILKRARLSLAKKARKVSAL